MTQKETLIKSFSDELKDKLVANIQAQKAVLKKYLSGNALFGDHVILVKMPGIPGELPLIKRDGKFVVTGVFDYQEIISVTDPKSVNTDSLPGPVRFEGIARYARTEYEKLNELLLDLSTVEV